MMPPLREPVTIAQLKRHMDGRFDRLDRTKADRRDLRRYATKKDLRRFATKKDLRRFATKFATKKDLQALRRDIQRHFSVVAEGLEEQLRKVADGVAEVAAIKLHLVHHARVLDDHETRIGGLERRG